MTEITKESLIAFGMKETTGEDAIIFPMKKIISVPQDGQPDDNEIAICVTTMRNQTELCLSLPDGDVIYLAADSIEHLEQFEKCIASWEPNY